MAPISNINTQSFTANFEKSAQPFNIYNLKPHFNQPEWSYFREKSLTDILIKAEGPVLLSEIYNSCETPQDLKCVLALTDAFSLKDHEIRSLLKEVQQLPASHKNAAYVISSKTIQTKLADIRAEQKALDIQDFKNRHAPLKSKMEQFIMPNGPLSQLKPKQMTAMVTLNNMKQQVIESFNNGTPIPADNSLKDIEIEPGLTIQKAYDQYYGSMTRLMPKPRVSKIQQEAMNNFDKLDEISENPKFQRQVHIPTKEERVRRPLPTPMKTQKTVTTQPAADLKKSQKAKVDEIYRSAFGYFYGKGAPKDLKKGIELLTNAAKEGSGKAQNMLGFCYSTGFGGVKPDLKWAIYYYKLASKSGNPDAQFRLAYAFILGTGVPKDIKEAYKLLNMSAKAGHAEAQTTLGLMLYYGDEGINIDHKQAFELFKKAATKGNTKAQTHLGLCYLKAQGMTQNLPEALKLFKIAASKNDPMAQTQLAVCYYNGTGLPQNKNEAIRLLKLAADNSYPEAIELLDEIQNQ